MNPRVTKALVSATLELVSRRLWTRIEPDAPILLRVPGEEHPFVGCVVGHEGQDYGLVLLRGPDALGVFVRLQWSDDDERLPRDWNTLSATVDPWGALSEHERRVLSQAGFRARREQLAPRWMRCVEGEQMDHLGSREAKLLLVALQTVLTADDAGALLPRPLGSAGTKVLLLTAADPVAGTNWTSRWVAQPKLDPVATASPTDHELLRAARPSDESWHLSLLPLTHFPLEDGTPTSALLLAVLETGELISSLPFAHEDERAMWTALVDLGLTRAGDVTGSPLLPRRLHFDQGGRLEGLFGPFLASLGVALGTAERPAFLQTAIDAIEQGPTVLDTDDGPDARNLPDPDDLQGWKAAEARVVARYIAPSRDEIGPGATTRYFGSPEIASDALRELEQLQVRSAFVEWFYVDFRANGRARTRCEKALERKRLAPADRAVLEAHRNAHLSIFRIESTRPGSTLELEDLLSGTMYTAHDRALSGCGLDGHFVPMRLVSLGDFYFPWVAGPPLALPRVDRFLAELVRTGLDRDQAALRARGDLFGRLWWDNLRYQDQVPLLTNTDGDPLRPFTAVFRLADPSGFAARLARRDDLEQEPGGGAFVWSRPGFGGLGPESRTLLGRIETFDDRAVLEVNSERRLERAKQWLLELPGVTFESARERDDEPALDDRLASPEDPVGPELLDQLRALTERMLVANLDQPVPAFGGRTPRQHVRTPEGRREVELWIRTLPPIGIPGGTLPPPRERLRQELGLE